MRPRSSSSSCGTALKPFFDMNGYSGREKVVRELWGPGERCAREGGKQIASSLKAFKLSMSGFKAERDKHDAACSLQSMTASSHRLPNKEAESNVVPDWKTLVTWLGMISGDKREGEKHPGESFPRSALETSLYE